MGRISIDLNNKSLVDKDARRLVQIIKGYPCTIEALKKWQSEVDESFSSFECEVKAYYDGAELISKELCDVFAAIGRELPSVEMGAYIDFSGSPPPKGINIITRGGFYVVMLKEGKAFYEDVPFS